MRSASAYRLSCLLFCALCSQTVLRAAEPPPVPVLTNFIKTNEQRMVNFAPYPGAQTYTLLSTTNMAVPFTPDTNFFPYLYLITNYSTNVVEGANVVTTNITGHFDWRATNVQDLEYDPGMELYRQGRVHQLRVTTLSSNDQLTAIVLNRLAYGQTPDELARVRSIGPQAYINEQLSPWTITEDVANTHTNLPFIEAKFIAATNFVWPTNASISDFRAWHILRGVGARRQFLEILLQFLENHFVTQWSKTANSYFDQYYDDGNIQNRLGAQMEYLEVEKWRNALLNPACTFQDLLKISAESPAMIIYLDTVTSRGDGSNVANENYARELLELFTFGVDNGYDQNDIVQMSKAWTGWRIEKVDFTNAFNPFAVATTNIIPGSTNTSTTTKSNLYGAWAFNYKSQFHNNSAKTNFPGKTYPARFGSPWGAGSYQRVLTNGSGTNGIQDGYQVIAHLANQPFTEEYISVKLCRLLVHDDFPNPSTDPSAPEYSFYNYAAGNLSAEAQLVHACMLAWETNSPKGQIWKVVRTIVDSDLFRTHAGAQQKVKTPLEFGVSAIRALRSSTNGSNLAGSFTAYTDGYAIGGNNSGSATLLTRAGNMLLFDRDSPDGYPEAGPPWISAGTLSERLRFIQSFCIANGQVGHTGSTNDAGNNICNIVGLLQNKLPSSSWTNAEAVADFFLDLLYPSEGAANLALYRTAALDFLNTGDNGAPGAFSSITPVSSVPASQYDTRVRGMVGMLMTFQRFHEQ